MGLAFLDDEESKELKKFISEGDYIKALKTLEDFILTHKEDNDAWNLHSEEGQIFSLLAGKETNSDVSFLYKLASVECFYVDERLSRHSTQGLFELGEFLGSELYYKKCLKKAKLASSFDCSESLENVDVVCSLEVQNENFFKDLIKTVESRIANGCKSSSVKSKKLAEPDSREVKELKLFWLGLDIKVKRDFMKVRIDNLVDFVEGIYYKKGLRNFDEVLDSAEKVRTWVFWMCRAVCGKKFCSAEECKQHLVRHHAVDFIPSSEQERVLRIGRNWTRKISFGEWEPVDAEAAVEMIKNRLEDVKAFARKAKNGWSTHWPLVLDEERSKLLKEIKLLLVSFCRLKILPCSIRDWLMLFPVKRLEELQVSKVSISDLQIAETPQSICFLQCHELSLILKFLKSIKGKRSDGTDIVCRAVDSIVDRTRIREKLDFDPHFSLLLLDKRLLKSKKVPFDDDVAINTYDPSAHYAEAPAKGDHVISWLLDYPSVDKKFPTSIREDNLDIWVAALKAVQFTCRNLGRKYAKKRQFSDYEAALSELENLCRSKCEGRKNLQGDKGNRYAYLLCEKCEERVNSRKMHDNTELFLCAVQDVVEGSLVPTFDFTTFENCLSRIRKRKSRLNNHLVLKSIRLLKSVASHKVLLIDSKILLIDNSRISLLDNLIRLSVFDNRTHILRVLKPFMLNEIGVLKSKTKSHNAEAELLLEEEKRKQLTLKKKDNRNKESMPIPLGRNVAETLLSSSNNLQHVIDVTAQTIPINPLTPGQSAEFKLLLDILKEISDKITRTIPVEDSLKDLNEERESLLTFIAVFAAFTTPSSLFTPPGGIDQGLVRYRESPLFALYAMATIVAFLLSWFNFAYLHKYLTEDNAQNTLTQEGRRKKLRKRLRNSWIMLWVTVALFFVSFASGMFLIIPNTGSSRWISWVLVGLSVVKYSSGLFMFRRGR